MDRYDLHLPRASTAESNRDDCWMFKNRKAYTKARAGKVNERKEGVKKIMEEVQQRKDRDLGEGTSLYLQRRYDQQRNVGAQIVTSPREKLNQTQAGYQKDFNMFKSFEGTLTPKQQISPRDFYNEKLVIK